MSSSPCPTSSVRSRSTDRGLSTISCSAPPQRHSPPLPKIPVTSQVKRRVRWAAPSVLRRSCIPGHRISRSTRTYTASSREALSLDQQSFLTPCHKSFLFPVRALSKVFRGKFLEGLRRAFELGRLGDDRSVPGLCNALRCIDWVVYAKPPFAGPESVLAYLGRHPSHRDLEPSDPRSRETASRLPLSRLHRRQQTGIMHLDVLEFIRRFLLHVLPKGFVRIRHYGLLANRTRKKKIARCRELLSAPVPEPRPLKKEPVAEKLLRLTGVDIHRCPACRRGRMGVVAEIDASRSRAAPRRASKPQGRPPKPRGLVQRVLCVARPTRRRRLAEGSRSAALRIEPYLLRQIGPKGPVPGRLQACRTLGRLRVRVRPRGRRSEGERVHTTDPIRSAFLEAGST